MFMAVLCEHSPPKQLSSSGHISVFKSLASKKCPNNSPPGTKALPTHSCNRESWSVVASAAMVSHGRGRVTQGVES
jgi:hypothetical protein